MEQVEPLGQTITFVSPPDDGFDTYTAYKGNVGEPEWQCQIPDYYYGGFDGMPWHCVFADMLKKGLEGEQLWSIVEKPQSPQKVSILIVPGQYQPSGDTRASKIFAKMMSYTTQATTKKMDGSASDGLGTDRHQNVIERVEIENPGIDPYPIDVTSAGVNAEYNGDDEPSEEEINSALRELVGEYGPSYDELAVDALWYLLLEMKQRIKPIWCDPDVIKQMNRAWALTASGTRPNAEASFAVNGIYKYPVPTKAKTGNFVGKERIAIQFNTFALFHVHPNGSSMFPSTPENNWENNGRGDTGIADDYGIDIFVISQGGLMMYDHVTRQTYLLRKGLDWQKPC